jgi:sigma-B regulation protein RsbU (phosphoserine phosphatase)
MAQVEPGDVLVLYTDGITEAEDGQAERLGPDRLLDIVRAHLGQSAQSIQDATLSDVRDFTGDRPQSDDIALSIVVRDAAPER